VRRGRAGQQPRETNVSRGFLVLRPSPRRLVRQERKVGQLQAISDFIRPLASLSGRNARLASYKPSPTLSVPSPACLAGTQGWPATRGINLVTRKPSSPAGRAGRGRRERVVIGCSSPTFFTCRLSRQGLQVVHPAPERLATEAGEQIIGRNFGHAITAGKGGTGDMWCDDAVG
jgi:hypothetical protein